MSAQSEAASWQACIACGAVLSELDPATRCRACGGLLQVLHRQPGGSPEELQRRFEGRKAVSGVWRFQELVLPGADDRIVTHPEGNTPLLWRGAIADWAGVADLGLKHEGHNPTGSFKDRGMTVALTQALRVGARGVVCASTGNTSASLAAYAAQAGLPAFVLVPAGMVARGKLAQTVGYGATVLAVHADFDACLRLLEEAGERLGLYLVNSINPFRLEGQKTIIFELLMQRGWRGFGAC